MEGQNEQQTKVTDEMFKEQILHKLNELRKENFLCDTTVRVEGQDFPAHKNVLSATSDYFKAFFASELQVKENQSNLVELNDIKSSTIAAVLQFIYTGEASMSFSDAQDLVVASDYLIIPSLKTKAAQFLGESINASNCLAMESFASQYNCDLLNQAAVKYKCLHFLSFVKSEHFLSLEFEKVRDLMSEDELNISKEEEVYEAAMAWVKHDLSSRECFLPDLLKCLRLFSMSKYSLQKILNKEELIIRNPVCSNILYNGLDFFVFPDRFLGKSLKHRTSIQNEEHVVVITGGETDYGEVSDTDCFVLSNKKWASLAPIPHSCISEECIWFVSTVCGGRLYGLDGKTVKVSCYNPQENAWRARFTCLSSHTGCALTSFNEELYLMGGLYLNDQDLSEVMICEVQKYNPMCNEWTQLASMKSCRAGHCAVVLEDLIYVIGGSDGLTSLKSVESYDPSTNRWSKVPDMANTRKNAAGVNACGKIFVIGGYCDDHETNVEHSCEIFDAHLNEWSLVSSPKIPRCNCGIVSVDDMVYIFGGEDTDEWLESVECFDFKSNEWKEADEPMPRARTRAQASLLKVPKKFIKSLPAN